MPTDGRQQEPVVARFRSHGRALFWPSIALVATLGAVGYFYGRFPEPWQNLALLVGAVASVLLLWLVPLLAWLGRNYTVTTRRLVLRSGLFVRVRQELLHSRGYDVTVRQNSLQRMFGSGDVVVNLGLDRPVVLRDVPAAGLVQGAIHELMEDNTNSVASRRQQEESTAGQDSADWGRP